MTSALDEPYSCLSCGAESESAATECPQCGGAVLSARSIRLRGWWMIIFGLGLVVFMGVVIINQAINVYHSGEPDAKVRYTSGPWMIALMFGTLGLVLSFGVASLAIGIWQILYGKSNIKLFAIIISLFSLLMTIAYLVSWLR